MTDFDRALLARLWQLQQAQAATVPPQRPATAWQERYRAAGQRLEWRACAEHGPRIAALYGNGYDDAARKRTTRALARLEAEGLVEQWGEGRNLTHAKLTAEGEALARAAAP